MGRTPWARPAPWLHGRPGSVRRLRPEPKPAVDLAATGSSEGSDPDGSGGALDRTSPQAVGLSAADPEPDVTWPVDAVAGEQIRAGGRHKGAGRSGRQSHHLDAGGTGRAHGWRRRPRSRALRSWRTRRQPRLGVGHQSNKNYSRSNSRRRRTSSSDIPPRDSIKSGRRSRVRASDCARRQRPTRA